MGVQAELLMADGGSGGPAGRSAGLLWEVINRGFEELRVPGDASLIGSIGVLAIATRGQAGPGEVLLKIRGGTEAYIAWSAEPIARGQTVLVIESRGHRTVDVSEWADPFDLGIEKLRPS